MSWEKCAYRKKEVREQTKKNSAMDSVSKLATQKSTSKKEVVAMRNIRLLVGALALGVLLLMAPGVFAYPNPPHQTPTGGADARIIPLPSPLFYPAGTTNALVHLFIIRDNGTQTGSTEIEWICVRKEGSSTLPDRYIQQIKLYLFGSFPVAIVADSDGVLDSTPAGDDILVPAIYAGNNGALDTIPAGDDIIVFVGLSPVAILPGPNGILDSFPAFDDVINFAILPGPNGLFDTVVNPDDQFAFLSGQAGAPLLGIIRNPNLTDGVCFGQAGRLLDSIPNNSAAVYAILADFSMEAPDQLGFRLVAEAVPSNGLVGGADVSNSFIGASDFALSGFVTISNTASLGGAQLVPEQNDVEVEPGTKNVMLGQFDVQDLGNDGLDLCVQHFTTILTGLRNGTVNIDVLKGLKSLALYVESGSTIPGFQPTDRLIGMITNPFLVGERITQGDEQKLMLVFGRRNRLLMRVPEGQIERLYVVGNLGTEFQDGDQIQLEVIAGARDYSGANCSSGFDIDPSNPVEAYNPVFIRTAPAKMIIGQAFGSNLGSGKAKVRVRLENIPGPGLDSLEATFVFDRGDIIADITNVRGLGNYQVDSFEWIPDVGGTDLGKLEVTVSLKPSRQPMTGDFDLLEIEFVIDRKAQRGDRTAIDVDPDPALLYVALYDGSSIDLDVEPGFLENSVLRGDVNGDGVVTRSDATLLARWLLGKADANLEWWQKQAGDADGSCPETTDWDTLQPGGCVNATDVRLIRKAAAGLITLASEVTAVSVVNELNGMKLLVAQSVSGGVEFRALNAERMGVQVFALSGSLVFSAETTTGVLRFEGISNRGSRLARGVYLYIVTLYGRDGSVWRSEVRKFIVR